MIPIGKQTDKDFINNILSRSQFSYQEINYLVANIMEDVKENGDQALKRYTQLYDQVAVTSFLVTKDQIKEAYQSLSQDLINDLTNARDNIHQYHVAQLPKPYTIKKATGITLSQKISPIEIVGMYVPGGSAAYPSTVLMNAVPAKIAGVKKLVMITPPSSEGTLKASILVAADLAGVDEIYTVGGAQGIAALTYGTASIPKVDKIVGPGNIYVSIAKKYASGLIGIDMIAGPSEIVILADEQANPAYIAADLMGQAEHDKMASAVCITTSKDLALKIKEELFKQLPLMPRQEIIKEALKDYGAIIVVDSLAEATTLINTLAPEHLELSLKNPHHILKDIKHAGAIFIGEYTPEPVGDYFAGTNHTLPTSQTARFQSPLGVYDFIKRTSIIEYSKEALIQDAPSIIRLAEEEGLYAHANAVKIRTGGTK